ncbi:MAG: PAS domain-containing methyl-accepting chemotaxis protein [Pseudomonadota bacterium]
MVAALDTAQAIIEFDLVGNIVHANDNFLVTLGYSLDEIVGQHHRIFCEPAYAESDDYKAFWAALGNGERAAAEFKRLAKDGSEIWINASYNPLHNADGELVGVVKFATNVTEQKANTARLESKYSAIDGAQAVIEFDPDGTIRTANANFLAATGYALDEIAGQHHRIFCEPGYANSVEYGAFWKNLAAGERVADVFKRLTKDGSEIWINASYNPLYDADGRVQGVVKFATDVTEERVTSSENESKLNAVEAAQARIEFTLDGQILDANDNFLATVGYSLAEIQGKHHRMFCDPEYAGTQEYRDFWDTLREGQLVAGVFKRVSAKGDDIWINASYNPVLNPEGEVVKVVKFATDVTEERQRNADNEGKLNALDRSRAIIEFDLEGNVLTANEAFLGEMKYRLADIVGKHHSLFCDAEYAASPAYNQFWAKLRSGEFDTGRYKRVARDGSAVWIEASYNPIFDADGRLYKVVKFASNITTQVEVEADVRNLAQEFTDASSQIAERSDNVANTAQSLGANTEEMNAAVEELTASIDSIASNSKNADQLAQSTQRAAEVGSTAINDSIEAMKLINKSSEDISEIVKVISEIASQTNLLALNAAIEAARAGEHGLGFSVVADEVRKLAERSSQATKEITQLISESVKNVNQGSQTSRDAVRSFNDIVSGVHDTTRAIAEISCAAEEQLIAAREVSSSIQQISEATEKSAHASEGIAKATLDLTRGAEHLMESANKFAV